MYSFFFFNDTATTEIYTLSLHDALPISHAFPSATSKRNMLAPSSRCAALTWPASSSTTTASGLIRSEEHTSELQSRSDLVCRLLLEKKQRNAHPGNTAP